MTNKFKQTLVALREALYLNEEVDSTMNNETKLTTFFDELYIDDDDFIANLIKRQYKKLHKWLTDNKIIGILNVDLELVWNDAKKKYLPENYKENNFDIECEIAMSDDNKIFKFKELDKDVGNELIKFITKVVNM